MYCEHCASVVEKALRSVEDVDDVRMDGSTAWVTFDNAGQPALARACTAVCEAGYFADTRHVIRPHGNGTTAARLKTLGEFVLIVAGIIVAALAIEALAGYNVFNAIPVIDDTLAYGTLFTTGVLTGLHCLSMCGALNLAASTGGQPAGEAVVKPVNANSTARRSLSPVFYNLGRLVSYTALGALAGAIGGVIGIDKRVSTALILVAGLVMVLMALRMAGVVSFKVAIPKIPALEKLRAKSKRAGGPFIVGLANGLMPCGPLQAMQLYAVGTGSAAAGALSMFLFCLGTIPFMLAIGYAARALGSRSKALIAKVAAAFMFALAISMVGRALSIAGINVAAPFTSGDVLQAQLIGDVQVVEFDLSFDSYANVSVKKGVPAQLVINVDTNTLTGCNNEIVIGEWGIEKVLSPGRNVIEFTPAETGTFAYSCWMHMITNTIEVTD